MAGNDYCNSYVRSVGGIIKALLVVLNVLCFSIAFAKDNQTGNTPGVIGSTTFASSLGSVLSVIFLLAHASGLFGSNGCGAVIELNYNVLWFLLYSYGGVMSLSSFKFSEPQNFFWRAVPILELLTAAIYLLETFLTCCGFSAKGSAPAKANETSAVPKSAAPGKKTMTGTASMATMSKSTENISKENDGAATDPAV